jgi:hypothetical protein
MPLAARQRFAKSFELVAELVGVALAASGATLAAVFGKLVLAAVLGFIAFGIILRLTSRRTKRNQPQQSTPRWAQLIAAAISIVEVAVIGGHRPSCAVQPIRLSALPLGPRVGCHFHCLPSSSQGSSVTHSQAPGKQCALTIPSRGQTTAVRVWAFCPGWCRRRLPLMSNVRLLD